MVIHLSPKSNVVYYNFIIACLHSDAIELKKKHLICIILSTAVSG